MVLRARPLSAGRTAGRLVQLAGLGLVLALAGGLAAAEPQTVAGAAPGVSGHSAWIFEDTSARATAGDVTVTFLEDRAGIAILSLEGDYDLQVAGTSNFGPREAVAREFYQHHPDEVDFLVVFTTFEFETGDAEAFHWGVSNDVEGIGLPIFDNSSVLGSSGRLGGFIDMAALSRYQTNPLAPGFDRSLGTLAHELLHQWCCYVEARRPDGSAGQELLGRDGAHWSYLLDSDGSLMYGADWRDQGDGTFLAAATRKFYSPLDLYLAGFLRASEVAPFVLLENPAIDPAQLPERGAVVTASPRTVTLEDVLAVNGPRNPTAEDAQKEYRLAFLLLIRPGDSVSEAQLGSVDALRRELAIRFSALTGGRGIVHGLPEPDPAGTTGLPPEVAGGPKRPAAEVSVADGLSWLRQAQSPGGFWQDGAGTRLRDTTASLEALLELDPAFLRAEEAALWLASASQDSTDALARRIAALQAAGEEASPWLTKLLAGQRADGGWGADLGLASDPLDTALALLAVQGRPEVPAGVSERAVSFLLASRGGDSSWGPVPGAAGRSTVTALVLRALLRAGGLAADAPAAEAALGWLAGQQSPADGGFGDSPSTSHDTAQVLRALSDLGRLERVDVAAAEQYLRGRQDRAGSWEGSVYATAVVVSALERLSAPNLVLVPPLVAAPAAPRDGERARLQATVLNDAGAASPATRVRFFDGDPRTAGVPLGLEAFVPALAAGQALVVEVFWDTFDAAGSHRIFAFVDPDGEVQETREDDNYAALDLEVLTPPEGVELELRAEDVLVSPAAPDSLPVELAFSATVRNLGRADAQDVVVELWRGAPAAEILVDSVTFPLLGQRSSLPANFVDLLEEPGTVPYTLRVALAPGEENAANNQAQIVVATQPSLDLTVPAAELSLAPNPAFLGTDARVTATIRNQGTLPAPSFTVRYSLFDGAETVVIREATATLAAGGSVVQSFPWRVDRLGDWTLRVEADPDHRLLETNESNNSATLAFSSTQITEPNLSLASEDLTFTPEPALEQAEVELGILVRNTGGQSLDGVEVAVFDGNPAAGGTLLAEITVDSLVPGEARPVTLSGGVLAGPADRLLFAVVDPRNLVAELDEEDNLAFRRLEVLSLPNISLSPASLSLDPPLPAPGQTVTLTASVANLGEQATGPFTVRAFLGDPAAGQFLGSEQILSLEGLVAAPVVFTFTLEGSSIATTVNVVADVAGVVVESNEDDNRAQRDLILQNADFFVSSRYFSPNGDGVQDATRLTYRLPSPAIAAVEVVAEGGETPGLVVRSQAGAAEVEEGSFLWDGKDEHGRVVEDGNYRLQVVAADGEIFGAALATLDVNRSALELAIGTPFGRTTNLSAQLGTILDFELTPGDGVVLLSTFRNTEFQEGLYRVALDRPVPETLVADVSVGDLAQSADGRRIAWEQTGFLYQAVWSASSTGAEAIEVRTNSTLVGFPPDASRLLLASGVPATVRSTAADGSGGDQILLTLEGHFKGSALSPDHRRLLVLEFGGGLEPGLVRPWLVDLSSGSNQVLLPSIPGPVTSVFSPDSSRLVLAGFKNNRLWVFDGSGNLVSEAFLPVEAYPREYLTLEEQARVPDPWISDGWELTSLDWSPLEQKFVVMVREGEACKGFGRELLVDAQTGSVSALAWTNAFVRQSDGGDPLPCLDIGEAPGEGLVPFSRDTLFWNPPRRILVGDSLLAGATSSSPTVKKIFEDFEDFQPLRLLSGGRGLLFGSSDAAGGFRPYGSWEDLWSFVSLLNLVAELSPRATADGTGFLLEGTAADLNFDQYRLEWSRAEAPDLWRQVAPPAQRPVVGGRLGLWVPPAPGAYFLRLTVVDLAGNRRQAVRQVASKAAPTLANLYLEPELFSTAVGARSGHVAVHYDVLAPVTLSFQILNAQGSRVRTFGRTHPAAAPDREILWDGRDDFGVPVPDGEYRVRVQSFELTVTVDSTPPRVEVGISEGLLAFPLPLCPGVSARRAILGHAVVADFSGAEPLQTVLELGEGLTPSAWQELCKGSRSGLAAASSCGAALDLPAVTGRRYRARAWDAPGNEALALADLPAERLQLTALGEHRLEAGSGLFRPTLRSVWYPDQVGLDPRRQLPFQNLVAAGPMRWQVRESLRRPIAALFLEYTLQAGPELWQSLPLSSFFAPGSVLPLASPPDHTFEVLLAQQLPTGRPLTVRLKAVDAQGGEHLSNLGSIFLWQLTFRDRLTSRDLQPGAPFAVELSGLLDQAGLDPARVPVYWGTRELEDPSVGVYLRIRSDDDPDYETWRRIAPTATSAGLYVVALPDLDPAAAFEVRLGREETAGCRETSREDYERRPDGDQPQGAPSLRLQVNRDFRGARSCGHPSDGVFVELTVQAKNLVPDRLELLRNSTVVFAVDGPQIGRRYRFEEPWPLPLTEELVYQASVTAVSGERAEEAVIFAADGLPPTAEITYPAEGSRVCPDRLGAWQIPALRVEGSLQDDLAYRYVLSLEQEIFPGARAELRFAETLIEDRSLIFGPRDGLLGRYGDDPGETLRSGDTTLRLAVEDAGGSLVCREVSFYLDGTVEGVVLGVQRDLFSPNGDGVFDGAVFTYGVQEAAALTLQIFAAQEPGVPASVPLRSLVSNLAVNGSGQLAWDGRGELGAPLADGRYLARATFVDGCGNVDRRSQWLEIDTTPANAFISKPAAGDPLGLVVEILGTADDKNFERYDLSWGAGAAPAAFARLGGGQAAVVGGLLAAWDTAGLEGEMTLRLVATDRVGNATEQRLLLTLPPRIGVIRSAEALPVLISPNGDGRLEQTALRFSLAQAATLDLAVEDESGAVVRTLLAGQSYGAGDHVVSWNGRGEGGAVVADGTYRARWQAAAGPELEEVVLSVLVDATAPSLALRTPAEGGFLRPAAELVGSVADPHLESWTLSVTAAGPEAWLPVATGRTGRVDTVLGNLGALPEGTYRVRLEARDRGETAAQLIRSFTVDDTPPVVALTAPVAGAFVSGLSGPVALLGAVAEEHLSFYRLEIGLGTAPTEFTTIFTASQLPVADLLASWNPAGTGEGPALLRLVAEDLAGGRGEFTVPVTVDNTAPQVAILEPAPGGYITGAQDILGTAADDHLELYSLDLAPAGTSQLSSLATARQSVLGGRLAAWRALPPDGVYDLHLTAEDRAGNRAGTTITVTVDLTPPPAPRGLTVAAEGGTKARLNWNAVAVPDLAGYLLLRNGQRLTPEPQGETTYLDSTLASGSNVYKVLAMDAAGNESEPSAEVELTVDLTPPLAALTAPRQGSRVSGLVDVLGTAYSADDFREYRLKVGAGDGSSGTVTLRTSPAAVQSDLLGQWSTLGLAEDSIHTLRLEAEDLVGNVAVRQITVQVDNAPPAAPANLAATVEAGAQVRVVWDAGSEGDLAGYLLYRGAQLVNGQVGSVGDPTQLLLRPSGNPREEYLDAGLPDGTFAYGAVAVDQAGNQSPISNRGEVTLETGAPRARLVEPADGAEFDGPLYLLAVAEDQDVAATAFEVRADGGAAWTLLSTDVQVPFEAIFDPAGQGLAFGEYFLRAVATDEGGRTDAAPPEIRVHFTDQTAPAPVTDLAVTAVHGGEVSLVWTSVAGTGDVAGYRVFRAEAGPGAALVEVSSGLVLGPSFSEAGLGDGSWTYVVRAVDTSGNASTVSNEVVARVYTPQLSPPDSPTALTSTDLVGSAPVAAATASGELSAAGIVRALDPVAVAGDGTFAFAAIPLERGLNTLAVRLTDAAGNTSKDASVEVISAPPPAPPQGLAATVTGQQVDLSWQPGPEPDLLGYRLYRDGNGVPAVEVLETYDGTAASSQRFLAAAGLILDGDVNTVWLPAETENVDPESSWAGSWVGAFWNPARRLEAVNLTFGSGSAVRDFDLEVELQGRWWPAAALRDNNQATLRVALPQGTYGTGLRFLTVANSEAPAVAELRVVFEPLLSTAAFSEILEDGTYTYAVRAINASGFESGLSEPLDVTVGDGIPPQPVVLTGGAVAAAAELSWTASEAPDVVRYDLFRDGVEIHRHTDLGNLQFSDGPLANGTYIYQVVAVDAGGNRSEVSNSAAVTVAGPLPDAPTLTTVTPAPAALTVSWEPAPSSTPAAYRLLRSVDSGGPYLLVAETAAEAYEDSGLTLGQTYYYVVLAIDALGNQSLPSNVGSGVPEDLQVLPAPELTSPARPGFPFVTSDPQVTVAGTAEPGTLVTLLRDGIEVGQAFAQGSIFEEAPNLQVTGTMAVSPEGRRLSVHGSSAFALSVYDFATNQEEEVLGLTGPGRWFPEGDRVAYANGGQITAYSVLDGSQTLLATRANATLALPGPDGRTLAVLGSDGVSQGLWLYSLDADSWTLLISQPITRFEAESIQWAPDGQRILYRFLVLGSRWRVVQVATAAVQELEPRAGASQAVFSPDSRLVALSSLVSGSEALWAVEMATGSRQSIASGVPGLVEPRFSPDGTQVALLDDIGFLQLYDLATGTLTEQGLIYEGGLDRATAHQWWWTANDVMVFNRSGRVARQGGGAPSFEVPDVALEVGDNVLTAVASKDGTGQSPASLPATVTRLAQPMPDLVITEADLIVLPALPRQGEGARLTVVITNSGDADAQASSLALEVLDPAAASVPVTSPRAVPALGVAESWSLTFDFDNLQGGTYQVTAVADSEGAVPEGIETNNRATRRFLVASQAAPGLVVTTDRPAYVADEDVLVTLEMTNGGDTFQGLLETVLEDASGHLIQPLATTTVTDLAFGETRQASAAWNTGNAFAGSYRVVARLTDGEGLLVAQASVEIQVLAEATVETSVAADRDLYVVGESARLTGSLAYTAGNAVLEGLVVRLEVLAADGAAVQQWSETLGSLLPGGDVQVSRSWSTAAVAPGTYRILWQVLHLGRPLGSAETSLQVATEAPAFPALSATKAAGLFLDGDGDGRPSPGDELLYRIVVTSVGEAPALGAVLEDAIQAPAQLVAGSAVTDRGVVESEQPLRVVLGDLAPGETASITFRVSLPDPWPATVAAAINQGFVQAQGIVDLPTDDPATTTPVDATVTPVFVAPWLRMSKADSLAVDSDGNGIPSPGDRLGYEITVSNGGSAAATALRLTDFAPSHSRIVAGSVTTTAGVVKAQDPVAVEVDSLAPGQGFVVRFEVQVDTPLPPEVKEIRNQATLASAQLPAVLSDDPDRGGTTDVTVTAVTAEPLLVAEKTVALVVDSDGDGGTSPGDQLEYRLSVRNQGNTAATGVVVDDAIPVHTALVAGSATTSHGTLTEGDPLRVEVGRLAVDDPVAISFRVLVDSPVPPEVAEIVNQGQVRSFRLPPVPTDDPALPGSADPTRAPVVAAPVVSLSKTATLAEDADGDGRVSPGDTLLYRLEARNSGNTAATDVLLQDAPDPMTAVEAGSVQSSWGTVTAEAPVTVTAPVLEAGSMAVVSFRAVIADPFPVTKLAVVNQAAIHFDASEAVLSDDPSTVAADDATAAEVFVTPVLEVQDASAGEASGAVSVTITLSEVSNRPVTLSYLTVSGTALAGEDFVAAVGTLVVAAGETSATVPIEVLDDGLYEGEESFTLELSDVLGAALGDGAGLVTLVDDEPLPRLSAQGAAVTEGDTGTVELGFTLTLSGPSASPVTLAFATADGTASAAADYQAAAGSLVLAPLTTSAVVSVTVLGDTVEEGDETFVLNLQDIQGAELVTGSVLGTIVDDDSGGPMVCPRSPGYWKNHPQAWPASALTLGGVVYGASGLQALLDYGGPDAASKLARQLVATKFNLLAGSDAVIQPTVDEADTFLGLFPPGSKPKGADKDRALALKDELDLYNNQEDCQQPPGPAEPATLRIDNVEVLEGGDEAVEAIFTILLSRPVEDAVTVAFQTAAGTALEHEDFLPVTGTATFPPGEDSRRVIVPILGGFLPEATESFFLLLSAPSGAVLAVDRGEGTIVDDDDCASPNLLTNPGAETFAEIGVPGWTEVAAISWRLLAEAPEPQEGLLYFGAGDAETTEIYQEVDVRPWEQPITAGKASFAFSGWLRTGQGAPSDRAQVVVEFRDETNAAVLETFSSGEVTSAEAWTEVRHEQAAPAGTGWIRLRLISHRSAPEAGNEGYFDGLSLRSRGTPVLALEEAFVVEPPVGQSRPARFALALSCGRTEATTVAFHTVDGTAAAGSDFAAGSGEVVLAAGTVEGEILIETFGDGVEEGLERFEVVLDSAPGAVLLRDRGVAVIAETGGGFCVRSPGYWKNHAEAWPVTELTLGAVLYDASGLDDLLQSGTSDASRSLARQLVATRFNLLSGSDPSIQPTADAADLQLQNHPPGSQPQGEARDQALALKDELDAYNGGSCHE